MDFITRPVTITTSATVWNEPHIGLHAPGCRHIEDRRRNGMTIIPNLAPTTARDVVGALVADMRLAADDVSVMDCLLS